MEYYWELVLKDGTKYEIPPKAVELVRKKMTAKEPINMRSAVIPFSEVKDFRQTEKRADLPPLIDDVARAFNEPQYTERVEHGIKYTGVKAAWVKKRVTQERWNNYYSKTMDKRIGEEDGMVVIAFVLPIHSIDFNEVQYCTQEEVEKLDKTW